MSEVLQRPRDRAPHKAALDLENTEKLSTGTWPQSPRRKPQKKSPANSRQGSKTPLNSRSNHRPIARAASAVYISGLYFPSLRIGPFFASLVIPYPVYCPEFRSMKNCDPACQPLMSGW